MSTHPTPAEIARDVVQRPAVFHNQPAVLASMWQTLVEARGGKFHKDRIQPPAHHVIPGTIEPIDRLHSPQQMARVRAATREVAAKRGIYLPPNDGVPA